MDFVIICLISAGTAALTLFSGFGLGTMLIAAFALLFPIEVAIAAAGVVHFANNLFKLALVGKWAERSVVLRFGVPAIIAALAGAALMTVMVETQPIYEYRIGRLAAQITWLKLVIALLLAAFGALELWPGYRDLSFPRKMLPVGGVLSGFFGGISGMQGALRAPFLLRAGLTKEQFIGTTNVISTMVDLTRLTVYLVGLTWLAQQREYAVLKNSRTLWLVGVACLAGFCGSYFGARMVRKVTLRGIRVLVAVLLFTVAAALGSGIV